MAERAELCLVDGDRPVLGAGAPVHERIVHGDATSATIAAASIVAKVARDLLMARLGERYPGYGVEHNAGYGTPEHMAAIAKLGPTAEHRLSFKPRRPAKAGDAPRARGRKPRRAAPLGASCPPQRWPPTCSRRPKSQAGPGRTSRVCAVRPGPPSFTESCSARRSSGGRDRRNGDRLPVRRASAKRLSELVKGVHLDDIRRVRA